MIHSLNTSITLTTMSNSWLFNIITFLTIFSLCIKYISLKLSIYVINNKYFNSC
jgi:hypothetical protein